MPFPWSGCSDGGHIQKSQLESYSNRCCRYRFWLDDGRTRSQLLNCRRTTHDARDVKRMPSIDYGSERLEKFVRSYLHANRSADGIALLPQDRPSLGFGASANSRPLAGWFAGRGLQIHLAEEYRKTRVLAYWIEESVTFDRHQQLIARLNCPIEPLEGRIDFSEPEMDPCEARWWHVACRRLVVKALQQGAGLGCDALPALYTLLYPKCVWARKMNHSEQSAQPEGSAQIPAPDQRRAAGSSGKAATQTRRMRSQANLLLEPLETSLARKSRAKREQSGVLSYAQPDIEGTRPQFN